MPDLHRSSTARLVRKIVVTIAGVAVLGVGVALLALPGPGVLVIALGFLILSSEYEWARRRFEVAKRKGAELARQAVSNPWSTALSIAGALLIIAAGIVWGSVSSLPFSSWWAGGSLIAGGLIALATIVYSLYQGRHEAPQTADRRSERSEQARDEHREVSRVG